MKQRILKPCHLFKHQGHNYVINIDRMSTGTVDEITANTLEMISAEPTAPLEHPTLRDDVIYVRKNI